MIKWKAFSLWSPLIVFCCFNHRENSVIENSREIFFEIFLQIFLPKYLDACLPIFLWNNITNNHEDTCLLLQRNFPFCFSINQEKLPTIRRRFIFFSVNSLKALTTKKNFLFIFWNHWDMILRFWQEEEWRVNLGFRLRFLDFKGKWCWWNNDDPLESLLTNWFTNESWNDDW